MTKKNLAIFTALMAFLCGISSSLHAEILSVSAGLPVSQSFNDLKIEYDSCGTSACEDTKLKADGLPTGFLIHANIPFFPGIGYERYETELKVDSGVEIEESKGEMKLITNMYDLFYLLPVPIVNITIGTGMGSVEFDCKDCSDLFKKGSAYQYFLQFGVPILTLFDIHFSCHSIKGGIDSEDKDDKKVVQDVSLDSTVFAVGLAFVF